MVALCLANFLIGTGIDHQVAQYYHHNIPGKLQVILCWAVVSDPLQNGGRSAGKFPPAVLPASSCQVYPVAGMCAVQLHLSGRKYEKG
jgi:hypothetical protein